MTQPSDLKLPSGKTPSKVVADLLAAAATFYLPDGAVDYEATEIHVLEHKKYLLGETHGDGTFATRTAKWPNVQTMKEGIKGMQPECAEEGNAVNAVKQDVPGLDQGPGLPLEDSHAYTLTQMLVQQQTMNNFDNLMADTSGQGLVQDGLQEVAVMIDKYADVGKEWCQQLGRRPDDGTRGAHFLGVGLDHMLSDTFRNVIVPVVQKTIPTSLITKSQRAQIQAMLRDAINHLLALIDTRPVGGGLMGSFQSKQGPDPIPNRSDITALAKPGSGLNLPKETKAAVEAGQPVREAAMIKNIKAAPAPLFVEIGDNHVDRVTAGVGADAVAVKKGVDFDAMTRKR
jgi:hypothetical protein